MHDRRDFERALQNKTSVEKVSGLPRKCRELHDTTHPFCTDQHWIEQINSHLAAKLIGYKRFKEMTFRVNYVILRKLTRSLQDSNCFKECENLCCGMPTDFFDDHPAVM